MGWALPSNVNFGSVENNSRIFLILVSERLTLCTFSGIKANKLCKKISMYPSSL